MTTTLKAAGASSGRRGFLNGDKSEAIIRQTLKLSEEVGEFAASVLSGNPDLDELADVIIVCATYGELLDVDLDAIVAAKCDRDEYERGYLHAGTSSKFAMLEPVPSFTPYCSKLAMKTPPKDSTGGDGYIYKDYS